MQTGETPMFSAEDRYIAAFALRPTPEPTPQEANAAPVAPEVQDTSPPAADGAAPTGTVEPVVEDAVAPPVDDPAPGDRGRGNGRRNGRDGDDDD
jgi:hypothetical protein